jgi:hypothetical protein
LGFGQTQKLRPVEVIFNKREQFLLLPSEFLNFIAPASGQFSSTLPYLIPSRTLYELLPEVCQSSVRSRDFACNFVPVMVTSP